MINEKGITFFDVRSAKEICNTRIINVNVFRVRRKSRRQGFKKTTRTNKGRNCE